MIRIKDLVFAYDKGKEPVLRGIDLQIEDGSYVALVGPNGCGKTTLLRHLNGLLLPTRGTVLVDGLDTRDPKSLEKIRQRVGMIFQNPDNQIVGMTVEEDVAFGPGNLGLAPAEIRRRVRRSLETVGMVSYAQSPPHALSGGEKRLVAIAGVLAMDPCHIALDEPTSFLDPGGRRRVLGTIKTLNEQGLTVIHVSHDMNEITGADRVLVMDQGRIVLEGTPREVFSRLEQLRDLGLDVPVVTDLFWRLRRTGVDVPPGVLSVKDACWALSALIPHPREGQKES